MYARAAKACAASTCFYKKMASFRETRDFNLFSLDKTINDDVFFSLLSVLLLPDLRFVL